MFRTITYLYHRRRFYRAMTHTKLGKKAQDRLWQMIVEKGRE